MRNSTDGPIQDQAVMLAIKHGNWSARQVFRELLRMNGHDPEAEPPAGFPSLRTIQRAIQRLNDDTPQDEEWSLLDSSPQDARIVLRHLYAFLELLQPARRPTRHEAELIARIATAGRMPESEVCWLAVWGARGKAQRRHVEDLLGGYAASDKSRYRRLAANGVIDANLDALMVAPGFVDPLMTSANPEDVGRDGIEYGEKALQDAIAELRGETE